jgi:hypothetical protein
VDSYATSRKATIRDLSARQLPTNHDSAATTIRVYEGDQPSIGLALCVAFRARPPPLGDEVKKNDSSLVARIDRSHHTRNP